MAYMINETGVESYHSSGFYHELPNGFPYWIFLMTLTPHRLNEGESIQEVPPGTCIIYSPHHPRYLYCAEGAEGFCNSWIHFTCTDSVAFRQKLEGYQIPINRFFRLRQTAPVAETLSDLVYEFSLHLPHGQDMIDVKIDTLLVHLSRNLVPYDEPVDPRTIQHLHNFEALRKWLYANPEQSWTVASMASDVYLSQNQFIVLYRSFFSVTPKQDLLDARIRKAKALLGSGSIMRDVAISCGFQNEYYFSTIFHKKTGLMPSAYAKINVFALRREEGECTGQ